VDLLTDFLLWMVVFGGVGATIGARKTRVFAGFMWGILLGPIGWLLIAAGPNYGPQCPACKGSVPTDATKCMHCGADLDASRDA